MIWNESRKQMSLRKKKRIPARSQPTIPQAELNSILPGVYNDQNRQKTSNRLFRIEKMYHVG